MIILGGYMTFEDARVLDIAETLACTDLGHPVRVAVDGITASGKSTVADAITRALGRLDRQSIHLTMDGFHHPRVHRHRQGRMSAEGYYWDAYDFDSLISRVLVPLGPGGSGSYCEGVIDLQSDRRLDTEPRHAPKNAVLVVDGTFLQRPPLDAHWDITVFVDTDFDTARERGTQRDSKLLGGRERATEAFHLRYHAASRIYVDTVNPKALATFVIDNNR